MSFAMVYLDPFLILEYGLRCYISINYVYSINSATNRIVNNCRLMKLIRRYLLYADVMAYSKVAKAIMSYYVMFELT